MRGEAFTFHSTFFYMLEFFKNGLCNTIMWGCQKLALGMQGRRSLVELKQSSAGKGQNPGLGSDLLWARGQAAAPLWAEASCLCCVCWWRWPAGHAGLLQGT